MNTVEDFKSYVGKIQESEVYTNPKVEQIVVKQGTQPCQGFTHRRLRDVKPFRGA